MNNFLRILGMIVLSIFLLDSMNHCVKGVGTIGFAEAIIVIGMMVFVVRG
jgi:hypothetical protein